MADTLDIALPKGRLGEKVVALLGESGMAAPISTRTAASWCWKTTTARSASSG